MKTALLLTCAMAFLAIGACPVVAADPPETKIYWYDVVVNVGQTTETITGAWGIRRMHGWHRTCLPGATPDSGHEAG